jgi:hypothetical protein
LTYQNQLIDQGLLPFPTPKFGGILGLLHLTLYLFGTGATLYFMMQFAQKNVRGESTEDVDD